MIIFNRGYESIFNFILYMNILHSHFLGNKYDFLDSGSYIMDGLISLNDHILYYEILLLVIVLWMLLILFSYKAPFSLKDLTHGSILEIIWTLVPAVILVLIALPSFRLLYLMDDILNPDMSIKVIGHQWYWSYSYLNINNNEIIEFDSYMNKDLNIGGLRNLDVDEHLILPSNTYLRFLITSTDVIHSWALPGLGIKMDAIPGRINQIGLEVYRPGVYYGQCSEICGQAHSFMPIVVKVI